MKIEGTDVETKIMPLYLAGKPIKEIADEFYIKNTDKLIDVIEEYLSKKDKKFKLVLKRIENISKKDLYILYQQGMTYHEIGRLYNISITTVRNKLLEYCKENNISFKSKRNSIKEIEEQNGGELNKKISKDFRDGLTLAELSEKYKISVFWVRKKLGDELTDEDFKNIVANRKSKLYISEDESKEILDLYESGKYTKNSLAKKYKLSLVTIEQVLLREYHKQGRTCIPTIVSRSVFLQMINNRKYTREQLIENAKKADKVIPPQYLDEFFNETINIDKIRIFVINQYTNNNQDEDYKENMFKSFNVATILKENGYELKYQAVAILYLLPKTTGASIENIAKVVNNDEEIIDAINTTNLDETSPDYFKKLEISNIAHKVKLAEKLDEIKKATLNKEPIDLSQYSYYCQVAKYTELRKAYEKALEENHNLLKRIGQEH